jgi:hypothetical protein
MKSVVIPLLLLTSSLVPASAATSLVVNPVNNRNDFTGVVGFRFTSTNVTTEIKYLGFVDQGGDGLNAPHQVGLYLWDGAGYKLQRSATVAAGTGADLHNGYRWVSIPTITLSDPGVTFWIVAATVANGDGDNWGDSFTPFVPPFPNQFVPSNAGTLDPAIGALNFAPGDAGYWGVGSLSSPYLSYAPGGHYSFYNAGNIATAIPETSTAVLGGLGTLLLLRRRR